MPAMIVIAWINFVGAGLLLLMSFNGHPLFLSSAVAAAISGCLFLAIDRALKLLAEIRDRLPSAVTASESIQSAVLPSPTPTRSLAEVEADLAKMQSRISPPPN